MRSTVILAAFSLAIGASGAVRIAYRPDGSIERISSGNSDWPAPERAKLARGEEEDCGCGESVGRRCIPGVSRV